MTPARDRVLGCLLGGALGDALGYPVEFIDTAAIRGRFGDAPPASLGGSRGEVALVSDDTQMTLFTAEGLLRAQQRARGRGISHAPSAIGRALLRWLHTQGGGPLPPGEPSGWLVAEPRLYSRRAPGLTCLAALAHLATDPERVPGVTTPPNDSKGCGAVMRVAPIGLAVSTRMQAFELGRDSGALTHGHPSGYLPAAYFAALIWDLARGADLHTAMSEADALLARERGRDETVASVARARALAAHGPPAAATIESLGGGWTGEEALAIALLCVLTHDTNRPEPMKRTLWTAAAHSGDSDSTAAIAGNLLGAAHGAGALPQDWLACVELRDVIERLGSDLFRAFVEDEPLDPLAYPPN